MRDKDRLMLTSILMAVAIVGSVISGVVGVGRCPGKARLKRNWKMPVRMSRAERHYRKRMTKHRPRDVKEDIWESICKEPPVDIVTFVASKQYLNADPLFPRQAFLKSLLNVILPFLFYFIFQEFCYVYGVST